jgi:hypothetical protein
VTLAEINKLPVGKVLDKLRRDDAPKNAKISQLDKKIRTTDAESLRLKRGYRGGTTGRD